jgi:hypothetical protein
LGRSFLTSWPLYWQSLEFAQLKRLVGENVISMVGARAAYILQFLQIIGVVGNHRRWLGLFPVIDVS